MLGQTVERSVWRLQEIPYLHCAVSQGVPAPGVWIWEQNRGCLSTVLVFGFSQLFAWQDRCQSLWAGICDARRKIMAHKSRVWSFLLGPHGSCCPQSSGSTLDLGWCCHRSPSATCPAFGEPFASCTLEKCPAGSDSWGQMGILTNRMRPHRSFISCLSFLQQSHIEPFNNIHGQDGFVLGHMVTAPP